MQYVKSRFFLRVVLVLTVLFCVHSRVARAADGFVISEVMYDPAGTDTNREWVEIYNGSSAAIDLSGHFFLTDGITSAHHGLAAVTTSSIAAGEYAVIVQNVDSFKADFPAYDGLIFDSSWSGLTASSGKTLAVIDSSGAVLDQVTYDPTIGANNDGSSLQRGSDGVWHAALPTPGAAVSTQSNNSDSGGSTTDTNTNSGTGGGLPQSINPKTTPVVPPHMEATLTIPKNGVSGIPFTISCSVIGLAGETRNYGMTRFAFGDGDSYSGKPTDSFTHTYSFPGTYVVTFEYRSYLYENNPDISERAVIEITDPAVSITRFEQNGLVEISNTSKTDADLSGWVLSPLPASNEAAFTFPPGTILLAEKKIILPARVTGFSVGAHSPLGLMLPSGVVSFVYGEPQPVAPVVVQRAVEQTPSLEALPLPALALNSIPAEMAPETQEAGRSLWLFALAAAIVIACAGFFLHKFGLFSPKSETPLGALPEAEPEKEVQVEEIHIIEDC